MEKTYDTKERNKPSSLAITCVIFGFLSCVMFGIITGLPSVIMGHILLMKINKEPTRYKAIDRKLAFGGLFFGYVGIIISLVFGLNVWQIMRT